VDISGALGKVEFSDVEFRYPGAEDPVLCGISFTVCRADHGHHRRHGSGKTTLINLVPRMYDATSGKRADRRSQRPRRPPGRPVEAHRVRTPKAFLFGGTVATNLRYGDESADEDGMWHALEVPRPRIS